MTENVAFLYYLENVGFLYYLETVEFLYYLENVEFLYYLELVGFLYCANIGNDQVNLTGRKMDLSKKSKTVAFVLTLLLGPLGLLYSSITAGVIMIILTVVTAATVLIPILCWIFSILLGIYYADKHNDNVDRLVRLLSNNNGSNPA